MTSTMAHTRLPDEEVFRVTKEGRKLKYSMTVIQQPERARACGSGAKSSADRRPVDPPPVVELRIFDVTAEPQDVTFAYDANFFLFATLENARQIAHGRMPAPAPQIPVLTGMPVSGMAYLDRPSEAGYFIFPDLSVRHEGKYKLSFNLYEETKDSKDADAAPPTVPNAARAPLPGADANASFDWRMEVKSNAFTVFSAKKFPGLAESTALSKTVAEQGCRVRIRRDVRMRRRDGKDAVDFVDAAEDEYVRPERAPTPVEPEYRRPSEVHDRYDARQPSVDQSRRQSMDDGAQPYPQAYTPSSMSSHSSGPATYATYGGMHAAGPYAAATTPTQPAYQPALEYHRAGQVRQPPAPYSYPDRVPYQHPAPVVREREAYESDFRRPSVGGYGPVYAGSRPSPYLLDQNYGKPAPYPSYPPRTVTPPRRSPVDLPPFKNVDTNTERSPTGPLAPVSRLMGHEHGAPASSTYSAILVADLPSTVSSQETRNNGKRNYNDVFRSQPQQALFNGQRPSSFDDHESADDDEDDFCMAQLKMQYKRADGSKYSRPLPSVQ